MGGAQDAKVGFCFWFISPIPSQNFTPERGRDGKTAAVANAFDLFPFPAPAQAIQQQLLKKKCLGSHITMLALCSAREASPEKGESVFFQDRRTVLSCLKHPPSHQTHGISIGPQRDEGGWADHCLCNKIKLLS